MFNYLAAPYRVAAKTVVLTFVVMSVIATALYFFNFDSHDLSESQSDWGTFGDYIGGIVGTLFSILAFVGVMLSLNFQQHQADLQRKQLELQELQRLLASISESIERILSNTIEIDYTLDDTHQEHILRTDEVRTERVILRDVLAQEGYRAIQRGNSIRNCNTEALLSAVDPLDIELQHLAECLAHYRQAGGIPFIEEHYRRRVRLYVCWLHATDLLDSKKSFDYFKPDELVRQAATELERT